MAALFTVVVLLAPLTVAADDDGEFVSEATFLAIEDFAGLPRAKWTPAVVTSSWDMFAPGDTSCSTGRWIWATAIGA